MIVFEASRQTLENAACTIEIYRDKKTGVGSLHKPRELDGRLPPDAGYYLDLVLPRFEEPRKKIGSPGEIIAWKNITNKAINLHAIQSQNISKFTSDISKTTSKFTSKTNQLRKNARSMHGGATPVVSYLDGDLVLLDLLTSLGSRFIYRTIALGVLVGESRRK